MTSPSGRTLAWWRPLSACSCTVVVMFGRVCLRLSRIKYKEEARKLLFKYAEAAKKMIDSRWVSAGRPGVGGASRLPSTLQECQPREQEGGEVER